MSLRFILGRAGSGKTRLCLNEMKSRIEEGAENPLVLLVPEQASFQAEKDLISVLDAGGILKTEVLSFQRMAFRIFNEVGGITYPHIHSSGKCMILYRILDKMHDRLKIFGKSSSQEGFVNTISTLITEFKRYGVIPEHLDKASQELPSDNMLRDKLSELFMIYAEYEKVLAKQYKDSDDDLTLASQKLQESSLYDSAEIWIDGFTNFTPQEYRMIGELLKKASRVSVCLCADTLKESSNELDVFQPVKIAARRIEKIARSFNIEIESPVLLNGNPPVRFMNSPELAHLERNLYSYPFTVYKGETRNVSLYSAMNAFAEIEACARDIIRLCRDENLRYRDISVVAGNLSGYGKAIRVIFSEYGIPCFIDQKTDITNNPLVQLVLSMMEIINDRWSYEAVFRYLKTGLTDIEKYDIDRLENYVLACGIRGSVWTSEEDWEFGTDLIPNENEAGKNSALLKEINRIRRLVTGPIQEFRERTRGRKTAAEFCAGLFDFLCRLGVPERVEKTMEELRENGELALASEYSQVWNILMEVFDQIVEVMDDEAFGLERFSKILKVGLGEYKIGLIPASLDQVLVGSVDRSRSHEIKALYILGANDGILPSAASKEGILSDNDRAVLNHMGLELASDTRTKAFDEQFLIYRILTTTGKYLRVSWPIADDDGRAMRPSMIVSRIKKLFPKVTEASGIIPSADLKQEMEEIAAKNPAFRRMVSALRKKADGNEISPVWQQAFNWFSKQEEWKKECEKLKDAFGYKNLARAVRSERIPALYGDPPVSSVSRLEKYTACPFAFYVQYGLGAKERKVYKLSPPDIGTFMHAVIERFSNLVSEGEITWRSFDREWCSKKVSEIVDEMLSRMHGSGIAASKRYTALTNRLKRVVTRAVWLIAEHIRRGSFEPVDYEVGFGESEKYPPITIQLDSGKKVTLTGRIDRVDALKTENGTYFRIIDYKSGTKDFKLSDVYYGLQIQLITYLDALWKDDNQEPGQGVYPGGMLYFKIDDPIIKGSPTKLTEEEIEASILRQLKMKGLLLADVKLIKAMDNTIEGSSMIIPAAVNKGDVLGKNTSGATLEQFHLLRRYVGKLLKDLCTEIMSGKVDIRPYKKKGITSCRFCSFSSICQFDPTMKENSYRLLHDKDNEEIWELMKESFPEDKGEK